jgi:hypothetical protein
MENVAHFIPMYYCLVFSTLPQYSLGFAENPFPVHIAYFEEVALPGAASKLVYGRVTGNLGRTLSPPFGS